MTTTIYLETGEAVQMTDAQRLEYAKTGVWAPPVAAPTPLAPPSTNIYNPLPPIYGPSVSPIVTPATPPIIKPQPRPAIPTGGVNKVTIPETGVGGGITWTPTEPSKVLNQLNLQIDDLNKRVSSLDQEQTNFGNRWKSYISGDFFTGSDAQWAKYKKEADALNIKVDRLNQEGSTLDKKQKAVVESSFIVLPDGALESKDAAQLRARYSSFIDDKGVIDLVALVDQNKDANLNTVASDLNKLDYKVSANELQETRNFLKEHIKLSGNTYINKDDFNKMNAVQQASFTELGIDAFNVQQDKIQETLDAGYKTRAAFGPEGYDLYRYLGDQQLELQRNKQDFSKDALAKIALLAGFSEKDVNDTLSNLRFYNQRVNEPSTPEPPRYQDIPTLKLTNAEKDFLVQQYYPEKLSEWDKLRPKYKYEQSMYRVTPEQQASKAQDTSLPVTPSTMLGIGSISTAVVASPLIVPAILVLGGYTAYRAIQAVKDFRANNGRDMTAKDAAFEIQNKKPFQEAVRPTDIEIKGEAYEYVQISSSLPPVKLSSVIAAHQEVFRLEKPYPTIIADNWPHAWEDLIDSVGFDPSIMISASATTAAAESPVVKEAEDIAMKAWQNYDKAPNTAIGKTKEWLIEYREWQKKKAALYSKRSVITAIPKPMAVATPETLEMEPAKPSTKHHGKAETIYLTDLIAKGATQTAIKAAKKAWNKAKQKGLTDLQAKYAAQDAVKEANQTANLAQTRTLGQTLTQTQTRTGTRTATQTRTNTKTRVLENTRTQTRVRTRTRVRTLPSDDELQIERVEGIPSNAGVISYEDGIVSVKISPPYRPGTADISFEHLKVHRKGKGSQEATLKVTGGRAPRFIQLSRGVDQVGITKGKRMTHSRQNIQRGPGVMDSRGRVHKQRRGSVI